MGKAKRSVAKRWILISIMFTKFYFTAIVPNNSQTSSRITPSLRKKLRSLLSNHSLTYSFPSRKSRTRRYGFTWSLYGAWTKRVTARCREMIPATTATRPDIRYGRPSRHSPDAAAAAATKTADWAGNSSTRKATSAKRASRRARTLINATNSTRSPATISKAIVRYRTPDTQGTAQPRLIAYRMSYRCAINAVLIYKAKDHFLHIV